jgi:hypothetical protein
VVGEAGSAARRARDGGDEAVLLRAAFPARRDGRTARRRPPAFACARFELDTIVLDDGFQHRALARDADLVLLAGDEGAQWTLPAGPLREWASGLARADAVLAVDGRAAACATDRPLFRGGSSHGARARRRGRDGWRSRSRRSRVARRRARGHRAARAPRRRPLALPGRRAGGAPLPRSPCYGADEVAAIARAARAATW